MEHFKHQLKKVAAGVSIAVGASVAGLPSAQADAILFPYVVASDTVTTVISVVNHASETLPASGPPISPLLADPLHYAYFYKLDPENDISGCEEVDFFAPSTAEDLVTFDAGANYGIPTNGVLFNDPTNYAGAPFNVLGLTAKPTRAFLVVDDQDATSDAELYGEAIVLEFANGASWGYRAYNSLDSNDVSPDFTNAQEVQGEVLAQGEFTPVVFHPIDEFVTRFLVTPVADNQDVGNLNARFELFDLSPRTGQGLVAWDRDENPISGFKPQNVVCVGAFDVEEMMTAGARLLLQNGGWTYADILPGNLTGSVQHVNEAVVFKLEYNRGGTINGEPVNDVINNAVWLRDNGSFTGFGSRLSAFGIDGF